MINYLGRIVCVDENGEAQPVLIEEFDFKRELQVADVEEGVLPKINLYKSDDAWELYVWTAFEEQMFQIVEQLAGKFSPAYCHDYKLTGYKQSNGPINECYFKVVKLDPERT